MIMSLPLFLTFESVHFFYEMIVIFLCSSFFLFFLIIQLMEKAPSSRQKQKKASPVACSSSGAAGNNPPQQDKTKEKTRPKRGPKGGKNESGASSSKRPPIDRNRPPIEIRNEQTVRDELRRLDHLLEEIDRARERAQRHSKKWAQRGSRLYRRILLSQKRQARLRVKNQDLKNRIMDSIFGRYDDLFFSPRRGADESPFFRFFLSFFMKSCTTTLTAQAGTGPTSIPRGAV